MKFFFTMIKEKEAINIENCLVALRVWSKQVFLVSSNQNQDCNSQLKQVDVIQKSLSNSLLYKWNFYFMPFVMITKVYTKKGII